MRDPKRIDRILELLKKAWLIQPDLRLCQLLSNRFPANAGDLFYIEDARVEQALMEFLKENKSETQA